MAKSRLSSHRSNIKKPKKGILLVSIVLVLLIVLFPVSISQFNKISRLQNSSAVLDEAGKTLLNQFTESDMTRKSNCQRASVKFNPGWIDCYQSLSVEGTLLDNTYGIVEPVMRNALSDNNLIYSPSSYEVIRNENSMHHYSLLEQNSNSIPVCIVDIDEYNSAYHQPEKANTFYMEITCSESGVIWPVYKSSE